jgi:hypothetical protein
VAERLVVKGQLERKKKTLKDQVDVMFENLPSPLSQTVLLHQPQVLQLVAVAMVFFLRLVMWLVMAFLLELVVELAALVV